MTKSKLLSPYKLGDILLTNRIVMAPMTRCRALKNIPNQLMAAYYAQRSDAGLIITEGTSPSPNGLGYARIPGIFNTQQIEGWKDTTFTVHKNEGKIFVQLMHTGRISHPLNMPEGAVILAPSAIKATGQMYTDQRQWQDNWEPKEMTHEDIERTKIEYLMAAKNAIAAGFDGVELHAANGYLIEQFISPMTNVRTDTYGGSIENRARFLLEIVTSIAKEIGKNKVGVRISPYGTAGDMSYYPEIESTYKYIASHLQQSDIAYLHLLDHQAMGAPNVPHEMKQIIRNNFKNTLILCGAYTQESAEKELETGLADLIAFGRPFINNPDLVERFANHWPLNNIIHSDQFYTATSEGYSDYPLHKNLVSDSIW